jgi:hypothetical protein
VGKMVNYAVLLRGDIYLIKSKCTNCGYEESPVNFFGIACRKGIEGDLLYVYNQCPICNESVLVSHFCLDGIANILANEKMMGMTYPENVCPKKDEVKNQSEVREFSNKKLESLRLTYKNSIDKGNGMVV